MQELVYRQGLTPDEARAVAPELEGQLLHVHEGSQVYGRTCRFFQQLDRVDVAAAWRKLTASTLAVHAEYDILTDRADLQRIAEIAGGPAQFVSLTGVDHFMHARPSLREAVDRPWGGDFSPKAAEALIRFLV